jgi:hypothetical protein
MDWRADRLCGTKNWREREKKERRDRKMRERRDRKGKREER